MQNSQSYVTLLIIWFVLIFSQLMFAAVVYFNKPGVFALDFSKPALGGEPLFPMLFAILALVNLTIAFILHKQSITKAIEERNVRYLQSGLIIGCALCEVTSLLGMVLAFIMDYQYSFLWFVLGAVGILLQFPRREHVRQASFKK